VRRTSYGLLAGLFAFSAAAWWWRRQRTTPGVGNQKGVVIFDNTPAPSTPDGNLTL